MTFLLLTDPASIKPNPAYIQISRMDLKNIILQEFTCIKMMRDPLIVRKKLSRLVMMSRVYSSFSAKRDKTLVTFKDSSDMVLFIKNINLSKTNKNGHFRQSHFGGSPSVAVEAMNSAPILVPIPKYPFLFI